MAPPHAGAGQRPDRRGLIERTARARQRTASGSGPEPEPCSGHDRRRVDQPPAGQPGVCRFGCPSGRTVAGILAPPGARVNRRSKTPRRTGQMQDPPRRSPIRHSGHAAAVNPKNAARTDRSARDAPAGRRRAAQWRCHHGRRTPRAARAARARAGGRSGRGVLLTTVAASGLTGIGESTYLAKRKGIPVRRVSSPSAGRCGRR